MRIKSFLAGALVLLGLATNVRAQATNGTVNFCNNRSNLLYFLQTGYPVAAGNGIKAALYWAPLGSADFVKLGAPVTVGVPVPGVFAGGTRVAGLATPGGAVGQFQVRAWGGPYSSYEQAFTNGGYCSGVSTIITMATGDSTHVAPLPPASLLVGGFPGLGLGQSPMILVPPINQVVGIGRTALFTVLATGTAPLSYQWQFNGTNLADGSRLAGSLTPALSILNVQSNDAGTYRVVVTNLYGVTVSSGAVLTPIQQCVPPPDGLIGWWKAEGNGVDHAGGNNAYSMPRITFTSGVVGQAFACDPYGYTGVDIADRAAYVLTNALSVEAWIRPRGNGYCVFYRGDHRPGYDPYVMSMQANNILSFGITDTSGTSAGVTAPISYNQWWHAVGTFDAASGQICLYTNGTLASQISTTRRPIGDLISSQWPGIGIGNVNDGGNDFPFVGDIDEASLYNRALTAAEVQALYNGSSSGKCLASPPVITLPPANQIVLRGSNAVFTVLAGGSPILGYQWRFNATNTLSGTAATLTIPNVQTNNCGDYQVIITNAYGSVTSAVATLSLALPPQIIVQPTNQIVPVGSTVAFAVTATGTPILFYQWRFNSTNLPVTTNATLSLTNVQLAQSGSYQVVVTNNYGSATSLVAMLNVGLPPQIIVQPINQAVLVGSNAAFTVTATGTAPLAYQWRFNGSTPLPPNTATLTIPRTRLTDAGSYHVIVTNSFGRATSDIAYLSVASPPQFQGIGVQEGALTLTWSGATGFTYQVQYKTNLAQLYWGNLGGPIFARGNVVTAYDVITSDRQRFYRVALLP
jgi:hypothetical protein